LETPRALFSSPSTSSLPASGLIATAKANLSNNISSNDFHSRDWLTSCKKYRTSQTQIEVFAMKIVSRVAFSVLTCLFLISAGAILPTSADSRQGQQSQDPAAQAQTVSGKVAAVDKSSFSINVTGATANHGQHFTNEAAGPKSMTFQIDKNTTVDGQLQVGANADVTYRQDHGTNIAISVHVS
jgi:hypothetical protein